MRNVNWTVVAVVIAATVPFLNTVFQHWLKTRSESKNATPNTAVREIPPLGAIRFITRGGLWFMVFVQWLAGAVAVMLIQILWQTKALDFGSGLFLALSALLFVCVQAFPWIMRRFPQEH